MTLLTHGTRARRRPYRLLAETPPRASIPWSAVAVASGLSLLVWVVVAALIYAVAR